MPLTLVRNDITKMDTDAIVNAANESLLGGGGVDGAIHRAAGPELLEECKTLGGCKTGEAKITKGYRLKARYVIHTVGPVYCDGSHGEEALLSSCYRSSLELAERTGLSGIAFPLISAGAYGYPEEEAIRIAVRTIEAFLDEHEMDVFLVFFDSDIFNRSEKRYPDLKTRIEAITKTEKEAFERDRKSRRFGNVFFTSAAGSARKEKADLSASEPPVAAEAFCSALAEEPVADFVKKKKSSLSERLQELDESFTEMLLRKIDEQGIKDSECYKKANLDRKLFSKIRSNPHYKPKKNTALAFAIALRLSLPETEELLKKAGYALSGSNTSDVIIQYFIEKGIYDIFIINEALFDYDQVQLGA